MLNGNLIEEIVKRNPQIDFSAVERSRSAAERLAEVGILLGGYRIQPALGGSLLKSTGVNARNDQEGSTGSQSHTQPLTRPHT